MPWSRYFAASPDPGKPPPSWRVEAANFAVALLGLSLIFYLSFRHLAYHQRWEAIYAYRALFWQGWLTTIAMSCVALVLSILLGVLSALARQCRILIVRQAAMIYVELIRGTPLLVQILIFYYVVFDAIGLGNRYVAGVLILACFSGAYISEILRAGIESVGRSQLESARAIGLTSSQTYRYVIFPQALRQSLPPLAGQFVSLVKDSSLLSIISVEEFTQKAEAVGQLTYALLESYLPLAVGYLILTLPISLWTRHWERRLRFET
jgi:polar amino acid transport system permease protein